MKDNLKWLLVIPVVIAVLAGGYLVGTLAGDNEGDTADSQRNQALELEKSDTQDRIRSYEGLISATPTDVDAYRGLADAYLELGVIQGENEETNESFLSYKAAVDNYRKHLAAKPDAVEARIDLGYAYFLLRMSDIGVRELRIATQQAPDNQRAWHTLGFTLLTGMREVEEAKAAFQKSYELSPSSQAGVESKQYLDEISASQSAGTQVPIQ